jgi:Winged helix DNA-binding domain
VNDVLSVRQVNRATLARQLLLARDDRPILDAVRHLVGLQAQVPSNPYLALWSRLAGFVPDDLGQLLLDRKVARTTVMRATIHLVTADDVLVLRPLMQPVLDAELGRHRDYAPALRNVDLDAVLAFARPLLAERPYNGTQMRAALAERFPDHDAAALAYACRCRLALVQVPPRGLWRRSGQAAVTTAEAWLGAPLATDPSIDDVVLRYLGAFGPATTGDIATWSRLTGLGEVVERLRPGLRPFRDERGRELFDLPDAPRPDPDTPAPPRFLPEYDNAVLSHADRSRLVSEEHRGWLFDTPGPVHGSVLHDGFLGGTWSIDRTGEATVLVVRPVVRLSKRASAALQAEGRRVLRFLEPETPAANLDVRVGPQPEL